MKKVQKEYLGFPEKQASSLMDLKKYRNTYAIDNHSKDILSNSFQAPLSQVLTMAAFMLTPIAVQSQCLVNSQSVDLDGDGNADIFIYSTFKSNGYAGAIRSIYQVRARAVNPNDQLSFFGTQFFPRSCYQYNCVFPTPDGVLSGVNLGSVAVLREQINSCQSGTSQVKSTNTYTISGNVYTTCTFFTTFTSTCQPTIFNGNFNINIPGTLGFKFNTENHFVELTIGTSPLIQKIDGAEAQPCDGGCQDNLELICNEVFPIDSYHAENTIETNDIVDVSQMVELRAGSEIELLPGFEVISGGELIGEIDGNCGTL